MAASRTVLYLASAAYTASGSSVAAATDSMERLFVGVNVTAVSGSTPSMTLTLETLGLDGVWYPVWTSSAITAAGKVTASIGPGLATAQSFADQVRLSWAITGTTPSFTFTASITGR